MRLYLSYDEAQTIKFALVKRHYQLAMSNMKEQADEVQEIIDRIDLCTELQKRERRARQKEVERCECDYSRNEKG